MNEEIECPKGNLLELIEGLANFKRLGREPGAGKKKRTVWIGDMTFDAFNRLLGIGPQEMYKLQVSDYQRRQNILAELHRYGSTYQEIFDRLRDHVSKCYDCSCNYLDNLVRSSKGLVKALNKSENIELREAGKKGVLYQLKQIDKRGGLRLLNRASYPA